MKIHSVFDLVSTLSKKKKKSSIVKEVRMVCKRLQSENNFRFMHKSEVVGEQYSGVYIFHLVVIKVFGVFEPFNLRVSPRDKSNLLIITLMPVAKKVGETFVNRRYRSSKNTRSLKEAITVRYSWGSVLVSGKVI